MGNLVKFEHYLESLCEVLGNMDRSTDLKYYCGGLIVPIARKSIELLKKSKKGEKVKNGVLPFEARLDIRKRIVAMLHEKGSVPFFFLF